MYTISKKELQNKKNPILTDYKNKKNLLVSFGGIFQGLGIPLFEFFNSISQLDCDKIYIRDFNQAWYHKGVNNEINTINKIIDFLACSISKNNYSNVCFLGNSMGGYAAILFGSLLNIKNVLSFAPQSFINKSLRKKFNDNRWSDRIEQVYKYKNNEKKYFDLKKHLKKMKVYNTQIAVYYSPIHELDKIHAERLKNCNNIILKPINTGGHEVIKTIRNSGELNKIINSIIYDN